MAASASKKKKPTGKRSCHVVKFAIHQLKCKPPLSCAFFDLLLWIIGLLCTSGLGKCEARERSNVMGSRKLHR